MASCWNFRSRSHYPIAKLAQWTAPLCCFPTCSTIEAVGKQGGACRAITITSGMTKPQAARIIDWCTSVSGLLQTPHGARVCYLPAHGAGAQTLRLLASPRVHHHAAFSSLSQILIDSLGDFCVDVMTREISQIAKATTVETIATIQKGDDDPRGRAEPLALPESSRTNADDRLPVASARSG